MLNENIRTATAVAITDCELLALKRADFEKIAEVDPRLGFILMRNIATHIAGTLKKSSQDLLKLATAFSLAMGCE